MGEREKPFEKEKSLLTTEDRIGNALIILAHGRTNWKTRNVSHRFRFHVRDIVEISHLNEPLVRTILPSFFNHVLNPHGNSIYSFAPKTYDELQYMLMHPPIGADEVPSDLHQSYVPRGHSTLRRRR